MTILSAWVLYGLSEGRAVDSLNRMWSKAEKPVIYLTLGAYLLLQFLMLFVPQIGRSVRERPEIISIFISVLLLYLFRFIDRRLPAEASESIRHFDNLMSAVECAFAKQPGAKRVDILGHSTQTFYASISDRLPEAVDLRVLIRNPSSPQFLPHITDKEKIKHEQRQIGNAATMWKDLRERKKIGSQKIYYYDFQPSFYLMILNSKVILLGFLEPCQDRWGFRRGEVFVIDGRNEPTGPLVRDLVAWLTATIKEKCREIE